MVACLLGDAPAARAQVTDLAISDAGGDVVLTWTTGTPPWRVIRSDSPDFYYGNRIVADGLLVATATDQEGASPGSPNHFYRVLESGEADPPGFAANPPRPVPFVTSLSPDSGKAGDVVTITGGNFEPTGATMMVTFDGLIADIIGTGETQLIVEVPEEVLTGYVNVCRAGICSNRLLFKVVVGPPFQNLSSIAFEPGTGSLWAADRGTADTVYEIDPAGSAVARGTLNQALLGHPTPGDGSGRVYYGNSLDSDFNIGTIEYIDSASNSEVFFDNAGQSSGTTTGVRCEGIAATDLEPEVVYYLDGRGNTIRRVVRDALAHDLSYGNQPFSFNSPAGARFDSAGNLYVSSTTALYRILPKETGVELVASGFTAASGIDLSEDTGIVMLLVADEATGAIWLVNGETGDKELVGSGLSAPVGVAFSGDLATGALFYDVAEPTRIVRLPDPRVEFLETNDVRILLSKRPTSDSYPSRRQTDNGQIAVSVKVTDNMDPAGTTIYFLPVDPKDPSKYLSGQQGDNLPSSPGGMVTPSAVVGADGIATAVLTVDPQQAGNNYRVEASLKPPPNFKRVARSPIYTSWRRLYIEHDRMYKQGEFLTQTSGAGQPDPSRVFVASSAIFGVGDEVHVLAGDDFSAPVGNETSQGEIGHVAAVGPGFVDLQAPLALTYPEPASSPSPPLPYSFIARRAGGTYDAHPSVTEMAKAFDDAFTEWVLLPDEGFVPHWPDAESGNPSQPKDFIDARSFLFFLNFDRKSVTPFINHVQVVSAAQLEAAPPPNGAVYGLASGTNSGSVASNWSWIFSGTIELLAPTNVKNVTDHVTAHELGHQLNVNPGTLEGHDVEAAWDASGSCQTTNPVNCCLMFAATASNTPGVPKFHSHLAAPSQDLLCIRTHVDDLNQDQCPPPFPGSTP